MKKAFFIIFAFVLSVGLFISCGSDAADNVGMPAGLYVPDHGHSGAMDGGILSLAPISVYSDTTITLVTDTTNTAFISWNGEYYDALNTHSTITNNDRFTIPTGYRYAILDATLSVPTTTTGTVFRLVTMQSGSVVERSTIGVATSSSISQDILYRTRVFPVTPGNYINLYVYSTPIPAGITQTITNRTMNLYLYR